MFTHDHVFGDLYLAYEDENHPMIICEDQFTYFSVRESVVYHGFCDDFGPMNLGSIHRFCDLLEQNQSTSAGTSLALVTDPTGCNTTNTVFLLGSYMILRMHLLPSEVTKKLEFLFPRILSYRDISPGKQRFHLHVQDCWNALWRATSIRWLNFGPDGFDVDEYTHYDDPRNADLHEIVPSKIIAMKGPTTLEVGKQWKDSPLGVRDFSPAHFGEILKDFDVQLVIRLNEPEYSPQEFAAAGIAVADLFFDDCTVPDHNIVIKFMLMVESTPGAVAVHCKAGLGRTGTLIALYIMKNFAFTAREAIAWLRIVRPGSIIGRQQQYLCDMEASIVRLRAYTLHRSDLLDACPFSVTGGAGSVARGLDAVLKLVKRIQDRVDESERRAAMGQSEPTQPEAVGRQPSQGRKQQETPSSFGSEAALAVHVWAAAQRRSSARCLVRSVEEG